MKWLIACLLGCLFTTRAGAQLEPQVFLHTREIHALALFQDGVWVASGGGIERYQLPELVRTHHLTVGDGLDSIDVLALERQDDKLFARTLASRCEVTTKGAQCEPTSLPLPLPSLTGRRLKGASIAGELSIAGGKLIGTQGAGLWLVTSDQTRAITPDASLCANHVQALTVFREELWVGGFREGLCVRRGLGFVTVDAPFSFVNALLATQEHLFVAAHEGLFMSSDGVSFSRVRAVDERGINGLAVMGDTLFVTSAASLYKLGLRGERRDVLRRPGGSLAIQSVSTRGSDLWLATEDRSALRVRQHAVTTFDALSGLGSSWVLDVAPGPGGTTYAATLKDGLFAISREGQVRKLPLGSEWLLKLAWVDDTLLVGSQDGLLAYSSTKPSALRLPLGCVHAFAQLDSQVWIGTETGLFAISREQLRRASDQTAQTRR